jgi:ABC-2 type transport system ATP-binding protein
MYDAVHGIDGVTLSVEDGTSMGLLGRNGAGKTTFVRTLLGLLKPSSGEAIINNVNVASDPKGLREITGYLPESFGLYNELTVYEVLDYTAKLYRIEKAERAARIQALLEKLELSDIKDMKARALSKGLSQKVGFARALMNDPKVIFLDEPTSGLDPVAARGIENLVVELKREGRTLLITSHILPEAEKMCDSVALIKEGHMLASGSLSEIKKRYCEPSIQVRLQDNQIVEQAELLLNEIFPGQMKKRGAQLVIRGGDLDRLTSIVIRRLSEANISILEIKRIEASLDEVYFKAMEE